MGLSQTREFYNIWYMIDGMILQVVECLDFAATPYSVLRL